MITNHISFCFQREIARLTNELTSATNCARSSSEREINELRMEIEELEKVKIFFFGISS